MSKVYQMLWDRQFCGTAKLLAKTHRVCPKCKAPQNPARRYFPSDADTVEVKNYTFQVWESDDQVIASGDSVEIEPQWPTPDIKPCDHIKVGCKQEGFRSETYTLKLIDPTEDKQHTCNVSYDLWQATAIGIQLKVIVKYGSAPSDSDCAQIQHLP